MDWNGMTTRKGALIEIHFEDEIIEHKLTNLFPTKEAILERLRQSVDDSGRDTDRGKVHILLNKDGGLRPMTEEEFAEWDSDEIRDWYHKEDDLRHSLAELAILLGILGALDGRNLRMSMRDDEFEGPTEEQLEKIFSDPNMEEKLRLLNDTDQENCAVCINTGCLGRNESFDMAAFEAGIARLSPINPKN